jgi:hypothetical protein
MLNPPEDLYSTLFQHRVPAGWFIIIFSPLPLPNISDFKIIPTSKFMVKLELILKRHYESKACFLFI